MSELDMARRQEFVNDALFSRMEEEFLMLGFRDVRTMPGASLFDAAEIDISSRFSTNVGLKFPVVGSPMDKVTEAPMAIALAKHGGIGIIHGALSIREQKQQVRAVKRELSGFIEDPITMPEHISLGGMMRACNERERPLHFRTFPVVDNDGKFVGLITQNDIDFAGTAMDRPISEIMTPASEVTTIDREITPHQAYDQMMRVRKKTLPIVNADGTVGGLFIWSDVNRIVVGQPRHNVDERGRLIVGAAVSTGSDTLERIEAIRRYVDVVVVDTSQGDSMYAVQTLVKIKHNFPDLDVVMGNVTDGESARMLAKLGANALRVGQGPGSICTTGNKTGIGKPQITAIHDCEIAVRDFGLPICADGGLREPGDILLAIAAGAHNVMMGQMLAGTKETPGEVMVNREGKLVKAYRGMGSASALRDNVASRDRYNESSGGRPLPQGIDAEVDYVGPVGDLLEEYEKGIRQGMSLVGAGDIETHRRTTRLQRLTPAGREEYTAHIMRQ